MYVNQESGWKDVYVMYNISKVNKLKDHMVVKESKFNNLYEDATKKFSEKKMIGYKVMNYVDGKAVTAADSRQSFPLEKGKEVSMRGRGIFLTLDKQYAIDYYAQHENNAVIKMEFDTEDVTKGNLTDKDTEFTVSKVKVLDYEIVNEDDL